MKAVLVRQHVQNVTFYGAGTTYTAFDCAHQMAFPLAAASIQSSIWEAPGSISPLSFQT